MINLALRNQIKGLNQLLIQNALQIIKNIALKLAEVFWTNIP